jgi:hypothetical protein
MNFSNCFIRLSSIAIILLATFAANAQPSSNKVHNLSDFGAVGDGVADDGPALQKALDALHAAGGGTLNVPAGRYLVTTPVAKDFSSLSEANVIIQGVPSLTMPAPPTALGHELAAGLDLTSEIIPATGSTKSAITLTGLHQLRVEHISFAGRPDQMTDAFITLYFINIDDAVIRHCEFYGISTFGLVAGLGGGNVVRADESELTIESSVFLGCTANSGAYGPIVENVDWRKFTITNSIFLDYGLRTFFGKMGLGAPLSWINVARAAATTPESPRREFVLRDTFLDEGGWIGITALPGRWGPKLAPIDLIYISGLKMNVSNLGTYGHQFYDVDNVLIENSHYGWSSNTIGAISVNRTGNVILDNLTCIDDANELHADEGTGRLTVINSEYSKLSSLAETTTILDTTLEQDPVQYVRQQFVSVLGRQPDPAAHFYWSDVLIRCGQDKTCLDDAMAALNEHLRNDPKPEFSITGTVADENGAPLSNVTVNLTGSQSTVALTDAQGRFQISGLPTSGSYSVGVNKRHYTFTTSNQTLVRPVRDVTVAFQARLNHHSITGRLTKQDGTAFSGVSVQLVQSSTTTITDSDGRYSFPELTAGGTYTIIPSANDLGFGLKFGPGNITFDDLSSDKQANFVAVSIPELLTISGSEFALAFDSIGFTTQPFSIFESLGFNSDGITRVVLFAKNLDNTSKTNVAVVAEDDAGNTYPLEIDFIGNVAGQSWLKQLNVKLAPTLRSGACFQLRVSVFGVNSNNARICIAD